jgi:uncharacterized protein (UPF0335 family)
MSESVGNNAERELQHLIERVERLEEEKAKIAEDIKMVFAEAKITGFDVKAMRRVIAERKLDIEERKERREIFQLYADKVDLYGDAEGLV